MTQILIFKQTGIYSNKTNITQKKKKKKPTIHDQYDPTSTVQHKASNSDTLNHEFT